MVGGMQNGTHYGQWGHTPLVGGTMGGPTVLFDSTQSHAVVLSPWQNFLAGSSVETMAQDFNGSSALEFGLLGSILSVPAGFEFGTAA